MMYKPCCVRITNEHHNCSGMGHITICPLILHLWSHKEPRFELRQGLAGPVQAHDIDDGTPRR